MNIEIRKTQFVNKGAELMLHAILEHLNERLENTRFVMAPRPKLNPYEDIIKLGFYLKPWIYKYGIQWGYFAKLIPGKIRKLYGLVIDSELDIVFDAGGFEYTDLWDTSITKELALATKNWKKKGTKFVMLPQAFGPFTSRKIKKAIITIVDNANIIYARDIVSYNHLIECVGDVKNIKIAPDFTNLLEGKVPNYFDAKANRFCIVPNARMLDKTDDKKGELYISFIKNCLIVLNNLNKKPFVLIHEGQKDIELAEKIIKGLTFNVNVISEANAIYIKGIIGQSDGVISSRFHGLVSGLSQGIPALGTGWSHKYQQLFNDYEFQEGLVDINMDFNSITLKIQEIFEKKYNLIQETLQKRSSILKQDTKKMWEEILEIIM